MAQRHPTIRESRQQAGGAGLTLRHSNFWFQVGCSVEEMTQDFCSFCLPSLKVQKGSEVVPSFAGSSSALTSRTSSAPCARRESSRNIKF